MIENKKNWCETTLNVRNVFLYVVLLCAAIAVADIRQGESALYIAVSLTIFGIIIFPLLFGTTGILYAIENKFDFEFCPGTAILAFAAVGFVFGTLMTFLSKAADIGSFVTIWAACPLIINLFCSASNFSSMRLPRTW